MFCGSHSNIAQSEATILYTTDGGKTFSEVYKSGRKYEMIWKASFPTRNVGYATIQTYDPSATQRYVAKTTDGGKTWSEIPLTTDAVREFGIGFVNENIGWVGTESSGYQTIDGGQSWTKVDIGRACNKIRILKTDKGFVAYGIGLNIYKLEFTGFPTSLDLIGNENILAVYPNPSSGEITLDIKNEGGSKKTIIKLLDMKGKLVESLFEGDLSQPTITLNTKHYKPGTYLIQIELNNKTYIEKIIIF